MKIKPWGIAIILSFALSGCAGHSHVIGYDISKSTVAAADLGRLAILELNDERPEPERKGATGKLLTFSSCNAHFSREVAQAIKEVLAEELSNYGFTIVAEGAPCDYQISGSIKHFQAIASPAKITFLPYLGSVATLWAKDEFTVALSIYIKMTNSAGWALIDKTFDVSEDMELPTGLLNLARYSRGFNYKLKLLDEALKDVMRQIRDEIVAEAKK